jgi:hypothetical protein
MPLVALPRVCPKHIGLSENRCAERTSPAMTITPVWSGTPLFVSVLLFKQIESAQCVAIGDQEQRRGLVRPVRDPVAVRQGEHVMGLPGDRGLAGARGATALADQAHSQTRHTALLVERKRKVSVPFSIRTRQQSISGMVEPPVTGLM